MKVFARADSETLKRTIAIFREQVKPERKDLIFASIVIPLEHFMFTVLPPLLIGYFTQSLITHPHDIQTPLLLVGGLFVCMVVSVILNIGFTRLFNHEERMQTRLVNYALKGLLAHSYNFFANSKVGSLTGDISTFTKSYQTILDVTFLQASTIVVNFVTSIVIIAFIAPLMLPPVILLTFLIIYSALQSYAQRGPYRNQRKDMASRLLGSIADTIGNQTLVRMFGRTNYEIDMIVKQRKDMEVVAGKEIMLIQSGQQWRLIILFLFQIGTLLLAIYMINQSLLSIAALVFIVSYMGRVTGGMFAINGVIRVLEQAFLDAAKVTEILSKTPEVLDAPGAKDLIVTKAQIDFTDVSFSYEDAKDQVVFKKMKLSIPKGQSVGLVGKSGGGKSTLTHLLLRYMDINKGEIMIDGQNIADVTQDSLRRAISYVPQDPYLFHRSLRDNIAYGKPDATDDDIMHAAMNSYAYEFIKELPHGMDTIVGERGIKLSGGQRQRVAIARAILKDAPILVLDEATSALDSESELYIKQALEKLMKDRTSIVIAHRLSTIAKLDRILVLDNGKIVEDGTHSELLKNKGVYARLWKHQSGGFIEE
ncbi:MAG: transporter-related protein [Candidatus Saccharibacteria bacterium]|nr:transporter-related protein [Candidatus Saccharibacteria bacterium]